LHELATGGGDVFAQGNSGGDAKADALEALGDFLTAPRVGASQRTAAGELCSAHRVIGDQVHVDVEAFAEFDQRFDVFVAIVDSREEQDLEHHRLLPDLFELDHHLAEVID